MSKLYNNKPSGLDTLNNLDELLISTNQMRDEFRRNFSFPLVLWVNDEIVQKLIKLAPDFYNWASTPISLSCMLENAEEAHFT